jgi:hypothetical protein
MKKQVVIKETEIMDEEIGIEKTESVKFINGIFTASEAKEVLLGVFRNKINFHNLRNWSFEERFGKPDIDSAKRLVELRQSQALLEGLIKKAEKADKKLAIESTILVSLTT